MSGIVYTREQKSIRLTQRYVEYVNFVLSDANLWNNLGFSLYIVLFVCYVVITLDNWMKSKMRMSADLVCHH